MFSKTSTIAAALLAVAPLASASGSVIIKNKCASQVYFWTVSNTPTNMQTLPAGETHTEPYEINPDGGGISIKIATVPTNTGAITQFEYTLDGMLWYDMSNINGYPFEQWGLSLTPSDSSCRTVTCPAGVQECTDAYNTPDQNFATAACGLDADSVLELCSENSDTPAPSPEPEPAPVHHHKHNHKHHHHHHHHDDDEVQQAAAPSPTFAVPSVAGGNFLPADFGSDSAVTPAPQAPAPANNNVHTTFVTQVVTVAARDVPEASSEPEVVPRHVHNHHRHDSY